MGTAAGSTAKPNDNDPMLTMVFVIPGMTGPAVKIMAPRAFSMSKKSNKFRRIINRFGIFLFVDQDV